LVYLDHKITTVVEVEVAIINLADTKPTGYQDLQEAPEADLQAVILDIHLQQEQLTPEVEAAVASILDQMCLEAADQE
jgi:hypothetical protein